MKVVVHDASVLIDLHHGGLLDGWLGSVEAYTTELVALEVEQDLGPFVAKGRLRLVRHTAQRVTELQTFSARQHPALSVADCSALLTAAELRAILLTGDQALRLAAETQGLEVHGMLWVYDELVDSGRLRPSDAREKLLNLMRGRARLPKSECEARLQRWGQMKDTR